MHGISFGQLIANINSSYCINTTANTFIYRIEYSIVFDFFSVCCGVLAKCLFFVGLTKVMVNVDDREFRIYFVSFFFKWYCLIHYVYVYNYESFDLVVACKKCVSHHFCLLLKEMKLGSLVLSLFKSEKSI